MTRTMAATEMNRSQRRRLLRKGDIAELIPCTVRGVELMIKNGKIPKPFYVSDASPRWRPEDIDVWLERLATEANQASQDGAQ